MMNKDMDSAALYEAICRRTSRHSRSKLKRVGYMVEKIYKEITEPPCQIKNSPFLNLTAGTIAQMNTPNSSRYYAVSPVDIYVIVNCLVKKVKDPAFHVEQEGELDCFNKYLFNGSRFGRDQMYRMDQVITGLAEIKEDLRSDRKEHTEVPDPAPSASQQKVQDWHRSREDLQGALVLLREPIAQLQDPLHQLQTFVSDLLNQLTTFSDTTMENYILRFADAQIRLYDLISDTLDYHSGLAEEGQDQNYRNLTDSLEIFRMEIVDHLADFGVEEIASKPGDEFYSDIHESMSREFSTKTAVVTRSLRSGFRYKDLILQMEKVLV